MNSQLFKVPVAGSNSTNFFLVSNSMSGPFGTTPAVTQTAQGTNSRKATSHNSTNLLLQNNHTAYQQMMMTTTTVTSLKSGT